MGRSSLRLGPVRVLPWFNLRNLGYNNNVNGSSDAEVGDWTASIGAGARLYLPMGSKTYIRLDALPEYTWYDRLASRRQWGGRGQAALLGFFNRLSFQVAGTFSEDASSVLTSEVPARVVRTGRDAKANVEIEMTRRISFFAGSEVLRERINDPGQGLINLIDVANYDRTDEVARAGVRYRIFSSWDLSLAAEETETRFEIDPQRRNNRSFAPLLGLHYDRPRFFASFYAGYRTGRPLGGSSFPQFQTVTGSGFLSYVLSRRVELSVFSSRHLVYGSSADNPYYIETRYGAGMSLHVLSRLSLKGYGNYGTNDYSFLKNGPAATPGRLDRVGAVGGGLSLGLGRGVNLTADAARTSYNSNLAGNDRAVFTLTTGLSFGVGDSR